MLSIFRRRMRDRGRDQARPECCRVRPTLEPLEDRVVPYNLSGLAWPSGDISVSYIPDGTDFNNYPSQLFSNLNAVAPTAAWQREFARALQTWAEYTNLNFRFVADDGSPEGVLGICQGNSQFGDIRLGSTVLGANVLGYTHYPDTETTGYTSGGDLALNSNRTYAIGTSPNPDLYSVALHELGHSLGLMHSTAGAVMYGAYAGTLTGLTSDDIAGIRAIYGIRQPDAYDTASANNSLAAATPLTLASGGVSFRADLTTRADVDYYRVVATGTSLTATIDARNLSLLAPKVMAYDAAGNLLGSAVAEYGQAATLNLAGLTAGQTYYLVADGATGDAFGTGAYALTTQFGNSVPPPASPPAAPSGLAASAASTSQINLTWQDNAANEDGFRVEQSTNGVTFTPAGTVAANVTGFAATGLSAVTTYYFRVVAYNTGGNSAWSNTAQATTQNPPPPPSLAPDRFEANDTAAAAKFLGKLSNTSQTGLTVHTATDVDYVAFKASSNGTYRVSVLFSGAQGNLDLYLYNAQQQQLAAGISTGDNEAVTLSLSGNQTYYIKVASPNGGTNTYSLAVAKLSGNSGGGGNLILSPDSIPPGDGVAAVAHQPPAVPGTDDWAGWSSIRFIRVVEAGGPADRLKHQTNQFERSGRSADAPGVDWLLSSSLLPGPDLPFGDVDGP